MSIRPSGRAHDELRALSFERGFTNWPAMRPIFKTAPLQGHDLLWVFGMSLVPFVGGELVKLVRRRD